MTLKSSTRMFLAALVVAAGLLGADQAPATAATPTTTALAATADSPDARFEASVQRLINAERVRRGRKAVRFEPCTDSRAERWATYLMRTSSFVHQPMDGLLAACHATYAGEILASGVVSARQVIRLWLASPGHRRVMLSRSPRRIGIGAVAQAGGSWLVAVNFTRFD